MIKLERDRMTIFSETISYVINIFELGTIP